MVLPSTVEKPIGSSKRLARPVNDEHASFWHELQKHPRTLAELFASPIGANFKSSPRVFAHLRGATARRYKVLSTWKRVFLLFQYPFILYFENDKETSRCKGLIYVGENCDVLYYDIAPDGSGRCNVLCIIPVVRRSIHHRTQQDDEDNYYLAFASTEKATWMFNMLSEAKKEKHKISSLSWLGLQETSSGDVGNNPPNRLSGSLLPSESVGLNPLPSLSPEVLLLIRYDKKKIEDITPSLVIPLIYNLLKDCRKFVTATQLPQQPYLLQNIQSPISSKKNRENTVFCSCSTSYFTEERRLVINTDYIHINVKCSHCGESPVIGFLYICTDCQKDEVSLCSSCFRIGEHNPQHNFSVIPDPYRDTSLHALKRLDKSIIPPSFLLPPLQYCTSPNFLISELILMEVIFRRIAGQHESGTRTMPVRKSVLLFFWEWSGVESVCCLTERDLTRVCRHVDSIEFREFCCLVHLKLCSTQAIIKQASNGEISHEEDNALAELCLQFVNRNNTTSALISVELGLLRLIAMLAVFEALETEHTVQDINDVRRLYIHTLYSILTEDALLHSDGHISGEETKSLLKLPVEGTGVLDCCALLVLIQYCTGVFHPHKKIEVFDKSKTFLTHAIDRINAKLKTPQSDRCSSTTLLLLHNRESIHNSTTNTNDMHIPSGSHIEEKNSNYTSMVPLWLVVEVFRYTCAIYDIPLSDHSACETVRRCYVGTRLKDESMYVSSTVPHTKVDSLYYVEFIDAYYTILSMWRDRTLCISLLKDNNATDKSNLKDSNIKKKEEETLVSSEVDINFSLRQVVDDVLRYSLGDPLNYYTTMSESIHPNGCDGCGMIPIIGYLFRCKTCKDYDLCLRCFRNKRERHNPRHTFSRHPDDALTFQPFC